MPLPMQTHTHDDDNDDEICGLHETKSQVTQLMCESVKCMCIMHARFWRKMF